MPIDDMSKLFADPKYHKVVLDDFLALGKANKLSGLEKIKSIYVSEEPFTIENEVLTHTMKIKRNIARDKYIEQLNGLYEKGGN
jgi:long-chain acyl-CoA synthetase